MSTLTLPQNDYRIEHAANDSGSVHVASLEALPPGFQFPGELRDRIWYDRAQQRLLFRGFMSKAMFDRLDGLLADRNYHRALEQLFRESVYEDSGSDRQRVVLVTAAVTLAIALGLAIAVLWL
jgi:hypothetical protein